MTRLLAIALLLAATFGMPGAALSQSDTGELVRACSAYEQEAQIGAKTVKMNSVSAGLCFGFFSSIAGSTTIFDGNRPMLGLCPPPNATPHQLIHIFLKHARATPEEWHQPAYIVAYNALVAPFRCQSAGRPN